MMHGTMGVVMKAEHKPSDELVVKLLFGTIVTLLLLLILTFSAAAQTYPIVDTGQFYTCNNVNEIDPPEPGEAFYGQDGQFDGNQPSYQDNGDGTITDLVTGLTWVQDRGAKMSWADAYTGASECSVGGYTDWRMPTIKELYSLINFSGYTGTSAGSSEPFINDDFFEFEFGDESQGERFIDCQDWSSTQYVHFTMMGDSTVFGVNFADGRIKGYPKYDPPTGDAKLLYVRYVRGNSAYGVNSFESNDDGTVTDNATGLMWQQNDSEEALNWEDALAWVQTKNDEVYLGHSDWRLPNAKELQSIVDYTRSPETSDSPAIDPVFTATELDDGDYPWYWTGTTHHEEGPVGAGYNKAVYVCFGRATGWMEVPPESGQYQLLDVHGAGAQRSDFKTGDPDDYPYGHGPQGDVIRIYNYIKLVRDADVNSLDDQGDAGSSLPGTFALYQNYPNPFNPTTNISFELPETQQVKISVYNVMGEQIANLTDSEFSAGIHEVEFSGLGLASGYYFYRMVTESYTATNRMVLAK